MNKYGCTRNCFLADGHYSNSDNKCYSDCSAAPITIKFSSDGISCIAACVTDGFYLNNIIWILVEYELTNKCHKCSEIDPLCVKCSAAAADCVECKSEHYVSLNKKKCVKSCYQEDSSRYINIDDKNCIDVCTANTVKYPNANNTKCIKLSCN